MKFAACTRRCLVGSLVMGLLWLNATAAIAASEARVWLDRMSRAIEQLNYQGTFVYLHEGELDAMRVVHLAGEDGERERLVSLSGPEREIVRDGDQVSCKLPDEQLRVVDTRFTRPFFPEITPTDWQAIEQHYALTLSGTDRVAGMDTQVVEIRARDASRYGYRLWLEEGSGMLLRSDLLDHNGKVLEQIMFTSIKLGAMMDRVDLDTPIDGEIDLSLDQENVSQADQSMNWHAESSLPAGFDLQRRSHGALGATETPVEHLMFTDGLASVSVYVEPEDSMPAPAQKGSHIGAMSTFSLRHGDHVVTAVGEAPMPTVEQIARAVLPRGD